MIGADDFSFFGMDRLEMVDLTGANWNRLGALLHQLDRLRESA